MAIFKIDLKKAQQLGLKRDGFGNEFNLRDFFAENLEEILGVRFLEKEYQTTDGRIDTLGIDENNSPVIVEYKWRENQEVFSQGLFYLDWLLKNKKHFDLLVKSKLGEDTKVSWEQPRVILIAQGFSRYIKAAVQRVENVELKTYSLYEGNILNLESEYSPLPEKYHSEKKIETQEKSLEYDLNYHLNIATPEMQKAFQLLQDKLLQLPSVEEVVGQKTGITYRTTKSFTRLEFRKTWIQVLLREPKYKEDTKHLVKDITSYKYGFLGLVKFTPDTDIDYLFELIQASYTSTL
jgi:hypothetical protein